MENDHRHSGFSHSKWWIFPVRYVRNYRTPNHPRAGLGSLPLIGFPFLPRPCFVGPVGDPFEDGLPLFAWRDGILTPPSFFENLDFPPKMAIFLGKIWKIVFV